MDLTSALLIYRLDQDNYTRPELDRCYKGLVKKYHPDRNQKYADWCHGKMTEINEAYELLMGYLDTGHKNPSMETSPPYGQNDSHRSARGDNGFFRKAVAVYLEGVMIYYDYGLTKRSIRQDGIWRFKFRKATKMMSRSLEEMEERCGLMREARVFMNFGENFLADIQAPDPEFPLSVRGSKTHVSYSEAVRNIDLGLAEFFSGPREKRDTSLTRLYRASHLFILLLENYPQSEWYNLSLGKLNLLDSFLDLQEILKEGLITF